MMSMRVHFSYGQRTEARELRSCRGGGADGWGAGVYASDGGCVSPDRRFGADGSEDCGAGGSGEEASIGTEVPVTYVPFRNAHFLSAAVSWAEVLGARTVLIGAVEQDSSGYPDCRPAYYEAFNELIRMGTKDGRDSGGDAADRHAQERDRSAGS